MNIGKGKKVFVGLSGGVDSSVTAALLQKEGYAVTGVFIKAWHPDFLNCTWKDDRRDAMRVCATLKIPFITLDLEKEYKQEVIDYMLAEYAHGRTPNPDVMCNKSIKFGGFLRYALEQGADYIATGHYAQRIATEEKGEDRYEMVESVDTNKDQTYFLWTLTNEQLAHVLFPVGKYNKSEIRKLAEEFKLPTYAKKDSQGLCFLGKVDLKDFLGHYFKQEKGKVLDVDGEIIGEHDGAWFYTLGERHGFKVFTQGPNEKPLYIIEKNVKENTLVVSNKEPKANLLAPFTTIIVKNINWINKIPLGQKISARMRYRQNKIDCMVTKHKQTYTVTFSQPQSLVSAGQSIVFYDKEICLGGAIIETVAS